MPLSPLKRPHPLRPSPWELKFQHMNLVMGRNIQATASSFPNIRLISASVTRSAIFCLYVDIWPHIAQALMLSHVIKRIWPSQWRKADDACRARKVTTVGPHKATHPFRWNSWDPDAKCSPLKRSFRWQLKSYQSFSASVSGHVQRHATESYYKWTLKVIMLFLRITSYFQNR